MEVRFVICGEEDILKVRPTNEGKNARETVYQHAKDTVGPKRRSRNKRNASVPNAVNAIQGV
jgi:hypothetical protein